MSEIIIDTAETGLIEDELDNETDADFHYRLDLLKEEVKVETELEPNTIFVFNMETSSYECQENVCINPLFKPVEEELKCKLEPDPLDISNLELAQSETQICEVASENSKLEKIFDRNIQKLNHHHSDLCSFESSDLQDFEEHLTRSHQLSEVGN